MTTKGIPPPLEFFFECPNCGTYRVSQESLRLAITPRLNRRLTKALDKGAVGAKLQFAVQCPKCMPNSEYEVTLMSLTARLH
jgi:transcription elongation factor Elf1